MIHITREDLEDIDPLKELGEAIGAIYNFTETHKQHVSTDDIAELNCLLLVTANITGLVFLKAAYEKLGDHAGMITKKGLDPGEVMDSWLAGEDGYRWNPILETSPLKSVQTEELN